MTDGVTLWYECPIHGPIDPVPMIVEMNGKEVEQYPSCPECGRRCEVKDE